MSANEIRKALTDTIVRGIIDWKMPFLQACLITLSAVAVALYSGLQDYKTLDDVDALTRWKLCLSAIGAACTALIGFLNGSFHRKRDEIKQREENENNPAPNPPAPAP